MSAIKKVQNTIFQHELLSHGEKIILGISGGPDSVAMLDIFAKLKPKYNLDVAVAHVNYGLRGRESDKDEKFVRQLAEKYGLEIFVLRLDEEAHFDASLRRRKNHSENELRDIRYDFFERLRKKRKYDLIAVAHTADDQVETYLMRTIRGAGMLGLSAMRPKSGHVIRPLLDIRRTDIVEYLEGRKLKWRTDKTNLETKYFRNRIRNRLIPMLEKEYNPGIKNTILESVRSVQDDYDFLDALVRNDFKIGRTLSAKMVASLHPALAKRVILLTIGKAKGDLKGIGSAHVREVIKCLKSTKNKRQVVIFKGLKLTRIGDKVAIGNVNNLVNN